MLSRHTEFVIIRKEYRENHPNTGGRILVIRAKYEQPS